jgi:hypothetical protein
VADLTTVGHATLANRPILFSRRIFVQDMCAVVLWCARCPGVVRAMARSCAGVGRQLTLALTPCNERVLSFSRYPRAFEFNELFLVTIHDCLVSSQFGTFFCNSEKERDGAKVRSRTLSNLAPFRSVVLAQSTVTLPNGGVK